MWKKQSDKVSINYFHTSTPQRSVELRMKKESRDLVASAGHLCKKECNHSIHSISCVINKAVHFLSCSMPNSK